MIQQAVPRYSRHHPIRFMQDPIKYGRTILCSPTGPLVLTFLQDMMQRLEDLHCTSVMLTGNTIFLAHLLQRHEHCPRTFADQSMVIGNTIFSDGIYASQCALLHLLFVKQSLHSSQADLGSRSGLYYQYTTSTAEQLNSPLTQLTLTSTHLHLTQLTESHFVLTSDS